MCGGIRKLLQSQVALRQFLSILLFFRFRRSPRTDIPLVQNYRLHFTFKQQVGNRTLNPGVVAIFTEDPGVPLEGTGRLGEHGL